MSERKRATAWNAWNASWFGDSEKAVLASDRSGRPQLIELEARNTSNTKTIDLGDWSLVDFKIVPRTGSILVSVDREGNEGTQLLVHSDDGTKCLTPDIGETNLFFGAFLGSERIAYSSNRSSADNLDIIVQNIDGSLKQTFSLAGGFQTVRAADVSRNALLISRRHSNLHNTLEFFDLTTEQTRAITADEARYSGACLNSDGSRVFCRTDRDSEFMRLAAYEIGAGTWSFLTPDEYDVDCFVVDSSRDLDELILSANTNGSSKLFRLSELDLKTHLQADYVPSLPKGVISKLDCHPRTGCLLVSLSTPGSPPAVWTADYGAEAVWTFGDGRGESLVNVRCSDFDLKANDGLVISGFVYNGPDRTDSAVVLIHGGPEDQARPQFDPMISHLVAAGFDVVCPNVRGSTGYGRSFCARDDGPLRWDAFADVLATGNYVRSILGYRHLAIAGGSYGGYVAISMMTFYPGSFDAAISIVGMTNLATFLEGTAPRRRRIREAEYGKLESDLDLLVSLSPIHTIQNLEGPVMLFHGRNDVRVPVEEALQLIEAASPTQKIQLIVYENEGHGLSHVENQIDAYERMSDFLGSVLSAR